jgi:uncharacterized zinc-type alcohol dehydrogenase-like protein
MQLKTYTAQQAKQPLAEEVIEVAELLPEQVLIEVTHCGVCRSDAHFVDNDWGDSQFPLVPGHEIVGIIKGLGVEVENFSVGQRIAVSWQQGACLECEWCLKGKEEFCQQLKAVCLGCRGGFADKTIVDSRFVYALPDNLESAHAAPLLCAGATVFHAMHVFKVKAGDKVGIVGMGGLGHLAIQFAKAMGCEVTVFSSSASKEQQAREFGASHFVSSIDTEQLKQQSNSLDFILSTVYVDLDYQLYVDALRPEGKLCLVGIPTSELKISVFSLVIGQKSICASPCGNRNTISKMLSFAAQHGIKPVIELMPMSAVNEALAKTRAGKTTYRIVLTN